MDLRPQLVADWPKLAWAASFQPGGGAVEILHGPCVERGQGWCAEAVWAGDFAAGEFDATELVFGTGVRVRGENVIFVSAGTMMDRLWRCRRGERVHVSNSLPCLLARADVSLREDYLDYPADIETQKLGLNRYKKVLPAEPCDLEVTYFRNLLWDGRELREIDKPDTAPEFTCYGDYHEYLLATAARLRGNIESPDRRHKIVPLASLSKGYDSCASAAIARRAGCSQAVTIENASSLLPRSDSGGEVARHLGLTCRGYRHTPRAYRLEETVFSTMGLPAGLNLTIFDYPQPLCIFFPGYRGDSLWRRDVQDRTEPFRANSNAGLSMSEFRLHRGVFHCLVPFWGSRRAQQIQDISYSPEMAPWSLGGKYDRPIPRRILEEAGVPRGSFGTRKDATAAPGFFLWPFSAPAAASLRRFLKQRGVYAPRRPTVWLMRRFAHFDQLVTVNLNHLFGWRLRGLRRFLKLRGPRLLFHWANAELKEHYRQGLAEMQTSSSAGDAGRPGP